MRGTPTRTIGLLQCCVVAACCWAGGDGDARADSVGTARQYVVNGSVGQQSDIESTVALIFADGNLQCTATLVTPNVAVTAMHCVENALTTPSTFKIAIGLLDVSNPQTNVQHGVDIERIYPACEYFAAGGSGPGPFDDSSFGRGEDIAFLRLAQDVPASTMQPTPILPAARRSEIARGVALTVTGYGTYQLQPAKDSVLHTGTTRVDKVNQWEIATERDASGQGTDSCFGDSGGPLYYTDASGKRWLVGVTSRGTSDSNFECGDGGIYAFASSYLALQQNAASGGAPQQCNGAGGGNPGGGNPGGDPGDGGPGDPGAGGVGGSGGADGDPGAGGSGGVDPGDDVAGGDPGQGGAGGDDYSETPEEFVNAEMAWICENECCANSPNAGHSVCNVCDAGSADNACAASDHLDGTYLDGIQTELCDVCAEFDVDHAVCRQCSSGAGGSPSVGGGNLTPLPPACSANALSPIGAFQFWALLLVAVALVRRRRVYA